MVAVIVLFFTFLVGGMMLALLMGYRTIEEERAQERPTMAAKPGRVVSVPGFFAAGDARGATGRALPLNDAALLALLEQHVSAEHAMVAQFVHYPSMDNLYRQSGSTLHVH